MGMAEFAFTDGSDGDFVALSGRASKGKLYRKHILTKGILNYQGQKFFIDDKFVKTLKKNFDDKVCDIVQVPVAGSKNEHTEDPFRNIGEVVDVELSGDKVYAVIDVRDSVAAQKIEDKLFLGASAMFGMNYTDTRDGAKKGPTLVHVAVTNRPHELELDEFEVLSLSADSSQRAVLLTAPDKEISMDLDDLIAILRDDHGIDVPELQRQAAESEAVAALSNSLRTALGASEVVELSAESGNDELVGAVSTLIESNVALSAEIAATKETARVDAATAQVKGLVKTGHILPAKEAKFLELRLSNEELFNELLPEEPIVALSAEVGTEPADATPGEVLDAEVARYVESAKANGITIA